jgi:hypothetical protein
MEYFEVQYLRAVSDYHTTGRIFLLEDPLLANLERLSDLWRLELRTVQECGLYTLETQLKAWFASMLNDYWGHIYAVCKELLGVNNEGPLALICTVIGELGGEDETEQLRTILGTHIQQTALAAVSRVHGGDAASQGDPVTALFEAEQQANELWTRLGLRAEVILKLKHGSH